MNVYSLLPLIATIVFLPLFFTTVSSRPWKRRHTLFALFLLSAMLWSLSDYLYRGLFFPEHTVFLGRIIIGLFLWTGCQFYIFLSLYFPPGKGRWLPFTVISTALVITATLFGFGTSGVDIIGNEITPHYNIGLLAVVLPIVILAIRAFYVLIKRLKTLNNPVLYNQIISLVFSLTAMTLFSLTAILPWAKEFPISHFGNILNAFILSYAVIRHRLVDIRLVLRQGTVWVGLGIMGMLLFWLILTVLHTIFVFQLDLVASFVVTTVSVGVSIIIYKIRGYFFELMTRAFQGSSYDYHRKLNEFTDKIHNVFSLKDQGGELLALLIRAINVKQACLLFPEVSSEDYSAQFVEPCEKGNPLENLRLRVGNPIIKYLEREQKFLSKENLSILPAFLGMWPQEKEEIESRDISLFVPLISRERVIAILVLGQKESGRFTLEDFSVIEDVTERVAVSLEKEYLREQLREREEELSVINNSSAILSSSLDIQGIFGSFTEELKKVIDVAWSSIVLIEGNELRCMALSSSENSEYQVGETLPLEGTGTGWVVTQQKLFIEPDLEKDHYFGTGENFRKFGLRTVVYLPLIAKGRTIGSFIVASHRPNAYNQRHIKLLEQLASQIAMPLENTQLYAQAEKKARVDELTGLLNRRSLDEMLDNEISRHSRYGGEFSMAIIDLDSFKVYNDTYGHLSGDSLLREVGNSIKISIRNADSAFRYGGDEFAIVLPQTDIKAATQVAERVRKRIVASIGSGDVPVTASIGIAIWPGDGVSHMDIIAAADATLYRAKRNGGNQTLYTTGSPEPPAASGDGRPPSKEERGLDVARALAETVDSKSDYAAGHSGKVGESALIIGRALEMDAESMEKLELSALLHDIGKIGISEEILNKAGDLTKSEGETMKAHSGTGAAIASNIPQIAHCREAILYHHEWYDGTGYPEGLKGDAIPLDARIIAIADAFTAMVSEEGPYARALTTGQALEELQKNAGTQFDPGLVDRFVSVRRKQEAGAPRKARR